MAKGGLIQRLFATFILETREVVVSLSIDIFLFHFCKKKQKICLNRPDIAAIAILNRPMTMMRTIMSLRNGDG